MDDKSASSKFAVIDFETANCYEKGSICSVGIVFLHGMDIVKTFYSLINPRCAFSRRNSEIHGIVEKDVVNQPTFAELWLTIGPMLEGFTLICYNASFDIYALERALYLSGIDAPNIRYGCALQMTRRLIMSDSYALTYMANTLGIQYEAHNALEDSLVTVHLLRHLGVMHHADSIDQLMRTAELAYKYTWLNNYDPSKDATEKPLRSKRPSLSVKPLEYGDSRFFQNKAVVFSGNLSFASRDMAQQVVCEMGGVCKSSVSKKTNVVIVGYYDPATLTPGCSYGSKLQAAIDLKKSGHDIVILNENDFMAILREGV